MNRHSAGKKRGIFFGAPALIAAAILLHGCDRIGSLKETASDTLHTDAVLEEVERIYEKARSIGEEVPGNVMDWAVQDVKKLGDWEYRAVTVPAGGTDAVERTLNELGNGRWECFWVVERDGETELFLKRPVRSYLKHIPLRDLLKVLPDGEAP